MNNNNKKKSNWLLQIKFITAALKSEKTSVWCLAPRHPASCCLTWAAVRPERTQPPTLTVRKAGGQDRG